MKTAIALIIVVATIGLFTASRAESKTAKEMPSKATPVQAHAKVAATKPSVPVVKSEKSEKTAKNSPAAAPEKAPAKNPLTPAQSEKLLSLLNEGSPEELATIPGIAKTRAASIAKARPFAQVGDLILVDGVGAATYEKVLAHGKTLTQSAKTAETAKKS